MIIHKKFAKQFPDLGPKITQAGLSISADDYVKRSFFMSILTGFFLCLILFFFTKNWWLFLLFPIAFGIALAYFMRYVDLKISKTKTNIDKEIVFAGRFLLIELDSRVPVYDAFKNLSRNYQFVGKYFGDVVRDVDFGTSLEDALGNAITSTPSPQLRKIFWQVLNSMRTGADVKSSLNAVLDQIVREQQIQVKEYGRKLNPLAMFYMMLAIIIPSLGTTMLVVMATFVGFSLPLVALCVIVGVIGFVQFMFFSFVKSSRPPMAL